ncbi:MAG TPA: glycosyltransferase [Polyangia bacterium]|nr:glycosyltransferase [Polyangia bacterium]
MSRHARSNAPEISVVLAVRDDEERIGHQVNAVAAHLRALGRPFEIVAVNDGSRDNTLPMLELLVARVPELRVVRASAEGRAFMRGAAEANGSVLILMDAARAVPLAPLGWALSRLAGGRDAVMFRGRYVVARLRPILPVIARASGPGVLFERVFERRAQALRLDVVGSRPVPGSAAARLLAPVLRYLTAS